MQRRFDDQTIHEAHRHAARNKGELAASDKAGCFSCIAVFDFFGVDLIKAWGGINEDRAVCPKCGECAVLGSASGYPVTSEVFLREMHERWFAMGTRPSDDALRMKLIEEARAEGKTYCIFPAQTGTPPEGMILQPESLKCLVCGMQSFQETDVLYRYCGRCKRFHEGPLAESQTQSVQVPPDAALKIEPLLNFGRFVRGVPVNESPLEEKWEILKDPFCKGQAHRSYADVAAQIQKLRRAMEDVLFARANNVIVVDSVGPLPPQPEQSPPTE